MSYEKNEWQTGDTITAEKLNNIENGIAGAYGRIELIDQTDYWDIPASYNELLAMLEDGVVPFVVEEGSGGGATFLVPNLLSSLVVQGEQYLATFGDEMDGFHATSPDAPMSQNTK